jgi:amidase
MKILTNQNIVFNFDRNHAPAIIIRPPEHLIVETLDARCGKLRKKEDVHWTTPDFSSPVPKVNPATGPIKVMGAQPGDAVSVKIEDISLDSQGFVLVKPNFGIIDDMVSKPIAKIVPVKNGYLHFSRNIRLPIKPMVGVLGTAPQKDIPSTSMVGNWGGNIDNKRIAPGATVFLPVFVDGAFVYIGDVHAGMGDAEATGTGVEICAKVKVKIDLVKNMYLNYPYIDTNQFIITMGTGSDFYKAARIAVEEMIARLMELKRISKEEAYMLISIAGDVRLNQACNCPTDISVRVEFPKKYLKK